MGKEAAGSRNQKQKYGQSQAGEDYSDAYAKLRPLQLLLAGQGFSSRRRLNGADAGFRSVWSMITKELDLKAMLLGAVCFSLHIWPAFCDSRVTAFNRKVRKERPLRSLRKL